MATSWKEILFRLALTGLLCGTVHVSRAALPPTSSGALDPTFNGGAPLLRSFSTSTHNPEAVVADRNGAIVVAGRRANDAHTGDLTLVTRYLADGSPDPAFAGGGAQTFGDLTHDVEVAAAVIGADRGVWMAGVVSDGAALGEVYRPWLARVDGAGAPVASFGAGGERTLDCGAVSDCEYAAMVMLADGRVAVAGWLYDSTTRTGSSFVDRYLADGSPDPSFGSAGRVVVGPFAGFYAARIELDRAGNLLIAGTRSTSSNSNETALVRLLPDGTLDAGFGVGGEADFDLPGTAMLYGGVAVQPDGKIVVGGYTFVPNATPYKPDGRVVRFNADGSLDTTFGSNGLVTLPVFGSGLGVQSDGGIVYAGQVIEQNGTVYRTTIVRLLPSGQVDAAFGAGGAAHPFDAGSATVRAMSIGPDDSVLVTSSARLIAQSNQRNFLLVRLIGKEITTDIVEFYNSTLNHYFITADPNEAVAIDNGAAGPGWSRTGQSWKSGGPNRVCRFYGSPAIDPATGKRRGPNGHFYTISAEECALVKEDAGWQFESYDFSGWPKQADGTCAAGTVAVKRAYNNRYAQNDSNHRYAVSDAAYQQMLNEGWSGEGTVFCAPQ